MTPRSVFGLEFAKLLRVFAKPENMAERVGFEPTVEFPLHTLSKRAPSTTRTSLRANRIKSLARMWAARSHNCDVNCDVSSSGRHGSRHLPPFRMRPQT